MLIGKVMTMDNCNSIIKKTILSMERPFKVSDLFYQLYLKDIKDQALILRVLDELCDNGLINYSEINDDCWAFSVIKSA